MSHNLALRNLLLRFVFSAFLAALSLAVARWRLFRKFSEWNNRQFDRGFVTFYAASHLLVFFAAFFVLHQKPWADLPAFYVPQAHSVMHGLVPYRDFKSSYAPLNAYLDAALLRLHDSPLSILVFQILCDIASVPFWIGFFRRVLNENTVRKAALLYLMQPLVIWEICLDGKNQGLIALLMAISFYALARREVISGVSLSLSWILVKILPVMFLPSMFFGARRRTLWLASVVVPSLAIYGAFMLKGADVLSALRAESEIATPQNLPYLFGALTGMELPKIVLSGSLLLVVGIALVLTIRSQLRQKDESLRLWVTALSCEVILLAVMLVNKKSDTSYLGMCFFLLCAFVAFESDRGRRMSSVLYAVVSLLALPIASFWYWPLHIEPATQLHALWIAGDRNAWIMVLMQALLALSYLGLAAGMLRVMRELRTEADLRREPALSTDSAS